MKRVATEILDSVELAVSDEPPTEFRLFSAGENATKKGKFVFSDRSASEVPAAFADQGLDALPFDASHLMLTSDNPEAKKALGWFRPEVRDGELWAVDAKWTPKTRQALVDREYRFFSPAIQYDTKTREILSLINVALTNLPATKNQTPLMLSEGDDKKETPMKLFELLGADDEGAAVVALEAIRSEKSALLSEVSELKAELAKLTAQSVADKRNAKLEALSAEGKLKPAQRAFAESLSLEQLEAFAATLEPLGKRVEEKKEASASVGLSADEEVIVKSLGISKEDYIKARDARKAG